jgi:hypothetical protein
MNIGLVFGVVVAIFMMALLLVFGYEQMTNVSDMQSNAETRRAVRLLETSVDRVYGLGGESSEKFSLSFPASVTKVCFVPLLESKRVWRSGRWVTERVPYTESDMTELLEDVIDGTQREKTQLSLIIINMRKSGNETLMIFHESGGAPDLYGIEHLEPGEKDGEMLCVEPMTTLWLQRKFDENGAWVDVTEA